MERIITFVKREKAILGLVVGWKAIGFVLIFLGFILLPFNKESYFGNFLYPKNQKIDIVSNLKTWDAQHYLYLSENGYKKNQASNSFYPLYPFVIRVLNYAVNNSFISGLILSSIFSFLGLVFLYLFVRKIYDKNVAFLSLALYLLFPTAFYLNLIYTEALFFFLSILFFYFLYQKKYFFASIFAFLLPLSRSFGIFVFVPFLIFILKDAKKRYIKIEIPTFNSPLKFKVHPQYFFLSFPLAGLITDFIFMYIFTGDFFIHIHSAQQFFVGQRGIENLFNPVLFFQTLFNPSLSLHGFNNSVLDRVFFIIFIALSPLVYKKTDKPMFFYYLLLGASPLLGSYMSYMRFLLPIFPLFITLGAVFSKMKSKIFLYICLLLFYSLQMLFLIMHTLNYWVS